MMMMMMPMMMKVIMINSSLEPFNLRVTSKAHDLKHSRYFIKCNLKFLFNRMRVSQGYDLALTYHYFYYMTL